MSEENDFLQEDFLSHDFSSRDFFSQDFLSMGDASDFAILMHRDAHFSGNFDVMIEYYEAEGKGVSNAFELSRIKELYALEKELKSNLSALYLSGPQAELVGQAKSAYKLLKAVYEEDSQKNKIPRLIADLILAETDEETDLAIASIVKEKAAIVPALLNLLQSQDFHNPLFPGYGVSAANAAKCLGLIGDKRAVISLFEAIGQESSEGSGHFDFFSEDMILDALFSIGSFARDFLLKVLHGRPLSMDNERAAIALIRFKDDPIVSEQCLQELLKLDLNKELILATYLVLACEGLSPDLFPKLLEIANHKSTPSSLRQDILILNRKNSS